MSHAYISDKKGKGLFRGALLALLFSLAFSLFTLTLSSAFLLRTESPSTWISLIGVLLPSLSALFGGIVSSKTGGGGALSGLLFGIGFVAVLLLLSFLLRDGAFSPFKSLVLYTAVLLIAVLGGVLGTHKRQKRRRAKRR